MTSRRHRRAIPDRSSPYADGAIFARRRVLRLRRAQSVAYRVVIEFRRPERNSGPAIDGENEFRVFGDVK